MPSKYPVFDRGKLNLLPLERRTHDMDLTRLLDVGEAPMPLEHPNLPAVAEAVAKAVARGSAVVLMMGAHVIKQGLSRYVIDMIRRGWVSTIACNGACGIHDYELARIGATTESVARYISQGQFGLWRQTGEINDIIRLGNADGLGYGEALGAHVASAENCPHKDASIFAAAYEANVPATVHVGIGYDITHEQPNCDGAAIGEASYRDFLIFTKVVENLEGGVVLCLGSAVMGPEVYLKALAMARNVAARDGREIRHFTSAVFDLIELGENYHTEAAKDRPEYYYRPFKTILVRTVGDGGTSHYIRGDHRATIPAMHKLLAEKMPAK